jgi:hypothetical protein
MRMVRNRRIGGTAGRPLIGFEDNAVVRVIGGGMARPVAHAQTQTAIDATPERDHDIAVAKGVDYATIFACVRRTRAQSAPSSTDTRRRVPRTRSRWTPGTGRRRGDEPNEERAAGVRPSGAGRGVDGRADTRAAMGALTLHPTWAAFARRR